MPIGWFNKKISNTTNIDQDITEIYTPIGVEGEDNYTLGSGAVDRSTQVGAAGSYGDQAFAPQFNFLAPAAAPLSGGEPVTYDRALDYYRRNVDDGSTARGSDPWNDKFNAWTAGLENSFGVGSYTELTSDQLSGPGPSSGGTQNTGAQNFGGAVQGAGFNVAGNIVAPIASGEDSFSGQLGGGGIIARGSVSVSGPLITDNLGTVNITTSDADIARAAIRGASDQLESTLDYANKALSAVGESRRDPGEKVTSEAINSVTLAAVALAALFLFAK